MSSQFSCTTGKITLSGGSTKSLILLTPGTPELRITEVSISLDNASATQGVQFDLYRVNSLGGSVAGTTAVFNKLDPSNGAAGASTGSSYTALTGEPSSVYVLDSWYLQPLGGLLIVQYPLGREVVGQTAGSALGIRYTTPTSVAPDCLCTIWFEE